MFAYLFYTKILQIIGVFIDIPELWYLIPLGYP